MEPELVKIRKCSECSGLVQGDTIPSGDMLTVTYWTDGKRDGPISFGMPPDIPRFLKCPYCQALLWIDEQEELEESELLNDREIFERAKLCRMPEFQDYLAALKINNLDKDKEKYLRLRAGRSGNDKRRDADIKQNLSDDEKENLQILDEMLSPSNDDDRLMKAEIKRELGKFEEAEAIFNTPFDSDLSWAASIISDLVQKREVFVAEMEYED